MGVIFCSFEDFFFREMVFLQRRPPSLIELNFLAFSQNLYIFFLKRAVNVKNHYGMSELRRFYANRQSHRSNSLVNRYLFIEIAFYNNCLEVRRQRSSQ